MSFTNKDMTSNIPSQFNIGCIIDGKVIVHIMDNIPCFYSLAGWIESNYTFINSMANSGVILVCSLGENGKNIL